MADLSRKNSDAEATASSIFRLGYVEFASRKIEAELDYYANAMGMRVTETGGDGTTYLSLGLNHHDIALVPSAAAGLRLVGLQMRPDIDPVDFAGALKRQGIDAHIKHDARPGIGVMVEIADIAGHRLQFFSAMAMPAPGFARSGIVPIRLGHVALLSPDADRLLDFFHNILGFAITDWIGEVATFLTCNHEHHVVNIGSSPTARLHHIAYALRDTAYHVVAGDVLAKHDIPVAWGPTRHTAGHNVASYHYDPDRTLVELYSEMDVFLPHLGICEPRPWHRDAPQRPKRWGPTELSNWETRYEFDLTKA